LKLNKTSLGVVAAAGTTGKSYLRIPYISAAVRHADGRVQLRIFVVVVVRIE